MSLRILDTDHASLFLNGDVAVCTRIAADVGDLAVTIVTVQEIFNGWIVRINAPSEAGNLVYLYTRLCVAVDFLRSVRMLNFDQMAQNCHAELLRENPKLSKQRLQKDMRIAAIALANQAIAITRNHRDFSLVPNLRLEDWS